MQGHQHEMLWEMDTRRSSKDDFYIPCDTPHSHLSRIPRSPSSCFSNGWLDEKLVKNIQEKTNYDYLDMKDMFDNLIENEQQLQENLNKVIEEDKHVKRRRTNLLTKKWLEQTFRPLHGKIINEMSSQNYENLSKEKRRQYENYLNHLNNKKGKVFLDVFQNGEYDPMHLNAQRPGPLKAITKKLIDPLLQLQEKRLDEERVVLACSTGKVLTDREVELSKLPLLPLVPLGRHGTKCSTWIGMEYRDIQSDVRVRSQEGRSGMRNHSNLRLYDSNKPVKDPLIAGGLRWQKKKQFPDKYATHVKLI